ncbi:MAG: radical SAM protein [Candidatus Nanoarchaeia archaeon]|nr:radical SAM protein [Candidatus Nanoarchaeia archaeon]
MDFPLKKIKIETTRKCNLDCIYCFNDSNLKREAPDEKFSLETIKKVIRDAKEIGLETVMITGGEPTLELDTFKLLKFCKELNLKTEIYSNGISLTPPLIDKLCDAGFDKIRITFLTQDDNKFQRLTRSKIQDYKNLIKRNITYLKNKKIYVRVGITPILKSSLNEFRRMLGFLDKLNVDEVTIAPLRRLGLEIEKTEFISKDNAIFLYEEARKFHKSNPKMMIRFVACWDESWKDIIKEKELLWPFQCGISWLFIGIGGDVRPGATNPALLGNIYQKGFDIKKMWQQNKFLEEERKLYLKCKKCGYRNDYCLIHSNHTIKKS